MPRKWLCESDCDYPGYHHRMELSQAAVRGGGAIHHGGSSDLHGTSSFCYRCLGEYIEHFQLMVQNVGRSAIPPDHECQILQRPFFCAQILFSDGGRSFEIQSEEQTIAHYP